MPHGSSPGERRGGRQKGTPNRASLLFDEALRHTDTTGDAVDFLTRVWRNPDVPASVRIDCAKVVAPFDRPRLTAVTNRDGKDVVAQPIMAPAELREWARQQIAEAFGPKPRTIEHQVRDTE